MKSSRFFNIKVKNMADNLFTSLSQNVGEQLRRIPKLKADTLTVTHTWLIWQTWATERRINPKLENFTGTIGPVYLAISENPKKIPGKRNSGSV